MGDGVIMLERGSASHKAEQISTETCSYTKYHEVTAFHQNHCSNLSRTDRFPTWNISIYVPKNCTFIPMTVILTEPLSTPKVPHHNSLGMDPNHVQSEKGEMVTPDN